MHTPLRLLSLLALFPFVAVAQPALTAPSPPSSEEQPQEPQPVSAPVAAAEQLAPKFTLLTSPLTLLAAGVVLEGEGRLSDSVTAYGTGEFYGFWLGWGFQAGARIYPWGNAMRGFFVDLHARANNLLAVNLIGVGAEVGGQHQLSQSRWSLLWSVGADIGLGRWEGFAQGFEAFDGTGPALHFTAQPKLRLMLGYQF
jgi:hypothetical protein